MKTSRRAHLLALEPRMMFDAAVAATNEAVFGHIHAAEAGGRHNFLAPTDLADNDYAAHRISPNADGPNADGRHLPRAATPAAARASHAVIFIDTGVANYQQLASEWASRGEVILINDQSDGLAQMEAALANETNVSAIHIVSHGEEGAFFLGTTRVDQASISGSLSGELAQIGKSLDPGGDILIYGCDFAEGADGAAALQAFATATGADVAASTDLTGAAAHGGDWTLEAHDGAIQARALSSSDYRYVLGPDTPVPIAVTANTLTVTDGNGNVVVSSDGSSTTGLGSDNRSPDVGVGAVAVWANAASYQGQALDLKATVVSLSTGDAVRFNAPGGTSQEADDATFLLRDLTSGNSDATVSIKWELVLHGTNTDAPADVQFTIGDIDGIGGQPNTRESVSASTDHLAYYTRENVTDINFTSSLSMITASGTQNENTDTSQPENSASNATFDWADVSAFTLNYKLTTNSVTTNAQFYQDGNATLKYTDPVYVSIPRLDLDADDSTAPGNDAHFTYTEDGGAVPIVDADVKVTNPMDTDSVIGATVVLTNAKSGDVLTVGALPPNISDTISTSNGRITVTFTGNGSEADYQDALKAVTFSNTLAARPDTTQRVIDVTFSNAVLTSATAVSRIDVVDVNHAPTDVGTLSDQSTKDGRSNISWATASGFSDPDGDALTYSATGLPTGLTIDSATGVISGTVDRSASQVNGGVYTVQVTATDPSNASATQSFHVDITNPPPVANNDTANTAEDTAARIAVLANDTDPDGDPLTVTSASAQHGSVAINPDGTITYTPGMLYSGSDTIDYAISDGQGGSSLATVAVTIQPQPHSPAAVVPGAQRDAEDTALVFSAANGNAITVADPDGGQQTVTLTTTHGTLTLGGTSGLTFTTGDGTDDATMTFTGSIAAINSALDGTAFAPAADYNGPAQIEVDVATVPVTGEDFINGDLEQPHVAPNSYRDVTDTSVPGWRTTESDHQIEVWGTGYNGVAAYQGNQFFEINANGAATLYQDFRSVAGSPISVDFAHRGRLGTDVMQVTAVDLGADGVFGTADDVVLSSRQYSDGNTAWGAYTQQITSAATGDLIRLEFTAISSAGGNTSAGNFIDAIALHQNSVATTDSKTIAITVTPVADIVANSATTPENTAVSYSPLANDTFSDPTRAIVAIDGTAITAGGAAVSVANGTVQLDNAEHLIFTPTTNYHGTTSYTYTVAAGGSTETGTDTILVTPVNHAPTDVGTLPDQASKDGRTISWTTASGFDDADGDTLTYSATGLPTGLTIDSATGVISGTVDRSASQVNGGVYTVQVTATDPSNAAATQSFHIDVTNPPPVANNDTAATDENSPVTIAVLANDTDPDHDPLSVTSASAQHGTVVRNSDGTLTYTPNQNYFGSDTIDYAISDGQGGTSSATVAVTVNHVNQAPQDAGTLSQRSTVDSATVSWATATGFSDPDGDTLSYSATGLPAGLTIDAATGVISGTLGHSDSQANGGHYAIAVTATDPSGLAATQNFVVDVSNPAPHAANDRATVHVDTPADITVLANDSDPDGDPIAVTAASAANGTVSINADGTLHYTPNAGFAGSDTIDYTITDGDGATAHAIVIVTVSDTPPAASPVGNQAAQDGQTVSLPVGNSFSDPDGDTLSFSATGLPTGLSIDPATGIVSGTIDRSASQSAGGVYNTVVTADDGHGGVTSEAFRWTITNPAPTARDDSATTPENSAVTIAPLANDSDPDGDPLTIDSALAPHGTVAINPDGTITYTPNAGFVGGDTIAYTITDGQGGHSTAHVAVTVTPVDNGPAATALGPRSDHDNSTVSVPTAQAFSDAAGNPLTYSATGLPTGVSIDPATGIISGTLGATDDTGGPNGDGRYPVTVVATDPSGRTATSGFTWSVSPTGPIARDDGATTPQETPVTIDVLANDSDPSGATFAVTAATAYHGQVSINSDGTLGFTPDTGFRGEATIAYTITDSDGKQASATVTVTVTPVDHAPTATPIPATYGQDAQSGIAIPAAAYFSDPDGDALTYSVTNLPPGLSLDPTTGLISGTIDHSASQVNGGVYHVVVTATDPSGAHIDNAFDWTITNPAPTAHDDIASTTQDRPTTVDVLANDVDPDGDALMVTSAHAGHGTVAINPDGTITYTPNAGYVGQDVITYTISDGQGGRSTAAVAMTVAAGTPPVANPDTATTRADTPVTVAVLANDSDPDGYPLTVASATAQHGTVAINPDGTITYTPNPGYSGADTIAYVVDDGHGGAGGSTVALSILPDAAPTIDPRGPVDTVGGRPLTIDGLAGAHDADGDPLTVVSASAAAGSVVVNPDGTLTYTPARGFVGTTSITYTIDDGHGGAATATIVVRVGPPQGQADTQQALAIGRGISPAWESPPGASGEIGDAGIGFGGIGTGGFDGVRFGPAGLPLGFDPESPIEIRDGIVHSPFPTLSAVNAIRSLDGTTDVSGETPIGDAVEGFCSLDGIGENAGDLGGVPGGEGAFPVLAEVDRLGRLADFRDAAQRLYDHRWGDLGDFGAHPFSGFSAAADQGAGVMIETIVQGGAIYVDVRDTAPDATAGIRSVDVTLAGGGKPDWIAIDHRGFAIIEAGAATDEIHLVVSVTRTDGSRSTTPVVVQRATGEIELDRHARAASHARAAPHRHPGRAAPLDATLHTPHAAAHAAAHRLSDTFK